MHLIRLIYASMATEGFSSDDVQSILASSRENNPKKNLTGILFHNNKYFLQCIEGSRPAVNELYHRILKDSRHTEPAIIQYEEISKRDFHGWSMGYIPQPKVSGSVISKYCGTETFQPYSMSGESCYRLLKDLREIGVDNLS